MPEFTTEEALAFIDATRLTLDGKVGFAWMEERLYDLSAHIESLAVENDELNAYVDATGSREAFEVFRVSSTVETRAAGRASHD